MSMNSATVTGTIRRKIIKRPLTVPKEELKEEPKKELKEELKKEPKKEVKEEPKKEVKEEKPEESVIMRRVYEIAGEILGDSFRPHENNLTVGKIVVPPELIAKWE